MREWCGIGGGGWHSRAMQTREFVTLLSERLGHMLSASSNYFSLPASRYFSLLIPPCSLLTTNTVCTSRKYLPPQGCDDSHSAAVYSFRPFFHPRPAMIPLPLFSLVLDALLGGSPPFVAHIPINAYRTSKVLLQMSGYRDLPA
jgi:hypothetical protein